MCIHYYKYILTQSDIIYKFFYIKYCFLFHISFKKKARYYAYLAFDYYDVVIAVK